MLRTYEEIPNFRRNCQWKPTINFWKLYELLETNDDKYNIPLYERIEKDLLEWIKKNCDHDVYYDGDLVFEFEHDGECDLFEKENGDPMAFKLTYA